MAVPRKTRVMRGIGGRVVLASNMASVLGVSTELHSLGRTAEERRESAGPCP